MNWLDVILVVTFVVYAYAGCGPGFVSNVFSGGGLLLGFLLAIALGPALLLPGRG